MSEEVKTSKTANIRVIIGILVLVGLLSFGIYYYLQYQKSQQLLKNPNLVAQEETQALVDKVSKLMVLPQGELPTVATVSDISKLKGQLFFANAKNGFKVLIYPKAQKAILYDPTSNKIVEVGPINLPKVSDTAKPLKVALYNGTSSSTLTTATEKQLQSKFANLTIATTAKASKSYTTTKVIDLTGTNQAFASQIATLLNGEVSSLPADEVKPTGSDMLVIIGK